MVAVLYGQGQDGGRSTAQSMGEIQTAPSEILLYAHGGQNRRIINQRSRYGRKGYKNDQDHQGRTPILSEWRLRRVFLELLPCFTLRFGCRFCLDRVGLRPSHIHRNLVGLCLLCRCHDPTTFVITINPVLHGSYRVMTLRRRIVSRSPCGSHIAIS